MQPHRDPHSGRLHALEKNILKFRALEMTLVLFHAERLKEDVLAAVQGHDEIMGRLRDDDAYPQRVPQGTRGAVKKCLEALVDDGLIVSDQMAEIEGLIDYRNHVGHRIHQLTADIGTSEFARDHRRYRRPQDARYDYKALERLRHFRTLLEDATSHRIQLASYVPLMFEAAEKTWDEELGRLRRKIEKQIEVRKAENAALSAELSLTETGLVDFKHPRHPLNQYADGRLTARGREVCYCLFDLGRSAMAVAVLMNVTLKSATIRHKMWSAAGGRERAKPDFDTLPMRRFYRGVDDD